MYGSELDPKNYLVQAGDVLDNIKNGKIDKSKIKNNAKYLKIKKYAEFKAKMKQAEGARIKADYSNRHVVKGEIESIFNTLEEILIDEGVIWKKN